MQSLATHRISRCLAIAILMITTGACATVRQGTVKYIEFDAEMQDYLAERPEAHTQEFCDLGIPQFSAELAKIEKSQPGTIGLKNFEIYTEGCFNLRGEVVK